MDFCIHFASKTKQRDSHYCSSSFPSLSSQAVNLWNADNSGTPQISLQKKKKILKNPQSKGECGSEESEDPLK